MSYHDLTRLTLRQLTRLIAAFADLARRRQDAASTPPGRPALPAL